MKIGIYPGSFDPVTNGHLDIVYRAEKMCDKLIVAVGENASKKPAFSTEERVKLLRIALSDRPEIVVTSFKGLLVDFAKEMNASFIIKGLRAVSDFEYEFQMALLNKNLYSEVETIFMATNINYSYLSSSVIKELAKTGGSIDGLVPECIKDLIVNKLNPKT